MSQLKRSSGLYNIAVSTAVHEAEALAGAPLDVEMASRTLVQASQADAIHATAILIR